MTDKLIERMRRLEEKRQYYGHHQPLTEAEAEELIEHQEEFVLYKLHLAGATAAWDPHRKARARKPIDVATAPAARLMAEKERLYKIHDHWNGILIEIGYGLYNYGETAKLVTDKPEPSRPLIFPEHKRFIAAFLAHSDAESAIRVELQRRQEWSGTNKPIQRKF